ncbi:TonB-dependent receptor [Halosquirtibacter xylanolyticus]|uniref:TonB-dependent receptor n=1 Tax=Halosquirtibacter xylanolyticus TaxID=3374599 RepID=UPI0037486093|nr:TonB-dependent receptor [Prolixibacteraceae bacterium]
MRLLLLSLIVMQTISVGFCKTANPDAYNKYAIYVVVMDEEGTPIPYASVQLIHHKKSGVTNANGVAQLTLHTHVSTDTLVVRYVGYEEVKRALYFKRSKPMKINIRLKSLYVDLDNVVVHGYSETSQIKRSSFTVSAIETKQIKGLSKDINQTLEEVPGVKIRQTGGMGSDFNFTINGFSGNQVKFFIDGIPMEFLGRSYGLNSLPINIAQRIEVYKGVTPVYLGADVLGAAVNIVTNKQKRDYLDFSYSYGSFNQNQLSVLSKKFVSEHVALFTNVIGNYADNDYKVDVEIYDKEDLSYKGVQKRSRFHDAYKGASAEFGVSLVDLPWVDELTLKIIGSTDYKEQQTGVNMTQVAGQTYTTSKMGMPSVLYRKRGFILKKLDLKAFTSMNINSTMVADTSSRKYNWDGDYTLNAIGTSGELLRYKTLLTYHDRSVMSNVSLDYPINTHQKISVNNSYSYYRREGTDEANPYEIPFKEPNILKKNILGVSYEWKAFSEKWRSNIFYKNYWMHLESVEASYNTYNPIEATYHHHGAGFSSTFFITDDFQLKGSFEKTYRLPQAAETLGNGLLILNNANLKPEQSDNWNFGFVWNKSIGLHQWMVEGNYFYRSSKDLIRLNAENITSHYENLSMVKGSSYNIDLSYRYNSRFALSANATYLDDVNKSNQYGFYDVRIPNKPYLYGNLYCSYTFPRLLRQKDALSLRWNSNYVHQFFLAWPNMGTKSEKYTIPEQLSHSLSVLYQLTPKVSLSVACNNLLDASLYDNYALQKPGRSFMTKVRYYISK